MRRECGGPALGARAESGSPSATRSSGRAIHDAQSADFRTGSKRALSSGGSLRGLTEPRHPLWARLRMCGRCAPDPCCRWSRDKASTPKCCIARLRFSSTLLHPAASPRVGASAWARPRVSVPESGTGDVAIEAFHLGRDVDRIGAGTHDRKRTAVEGRCPLPGPGFGRPMIRGNRPSGTGQVRVATESVLPGRLNVSAHARHLPAP